MPFVVKFGYTRCGRTHLKNQEELKMNGYTWIGNNRKLLHVNARCGSDGVGILIQNGILKEFECNKNQK